MILLAFFLLFTSSFVVFLLPFLQTIFFFITLFFFLIFTLRKLEYGIYILLGDLFVTSFGYLFQWQGISLRIGMAVVFVGMCLFKFLQDSKYSILRHPELDSARLAESRQGSRKEQQKEKTEHSFSFLFFLSGFRLRGRNDSGRYVVRLIDFIKRYKTLSVVYALLMTWIAASFIHGWLRNGFAGSFDDVQRYLYLVFLTIIPALKIEKEKVFKILKAGLLWVFIFVSVIEIVFAWLGENEVIYKFVRDFRFGEITPFVGNFWRVFLQSEVYAVVGLLLSLVGIFLSVIPATRLDSVDPRRKAGIQTTKTNKKRSFSFFFSFLDPESKFRMTKVENYVLFFISTVILLFGLSRSFWLGTAVSLILAGCIFVRHAKLSGVIKSSIRVFATFLFSVIFVMIVSNSWLGASKVAKSRIDAAEPAASSRSAQFGPLNQAIGRSPAAGYGFGKTLEYRSPDPRRVGQSGGTGLVRTWAFELGWHDMAIKTGLAGTLLYVSFIIILMNMLYSTYRTYDDIFSIAIFLSLLALIVIHAFTPYLNHPLGIGVLVISMIVLNDKNGTIEPESVG